MVDREQLGRRMEQARKEQDLTLKDVALEVGVAASTIQRYEKGQFTTIKMPVVEAIAAALHVNPAWLTGHTDDPIDYDYSSFLDEIPDAYRHAWLEQGLTASEMMDRYEAMTPDEKENAPAPKEDKRSEIQAIFDQLSADNRSKLLELAHLYLTAQGKTEET